METNDFVTLHSSFCPDSLLALLIPPFDTFNSSDLILSVCVFQSGHYNNNIVKVLNIILAYQLTVFVSVALLVSPSLSLCTCTHAASAAWWIKT